MLEAISNRDWAKADSCRRHAGIVARLLGDRGKEIQKLHGEAARAAREERIG